ncbi:MAG: SoxR reducing system RseC family protein [Bacillota bacterium]
MIKFGQIIERNEKKALVTVKFKRPEACGKCSACGIGAHNGEVTLPSDHQIGEWVRVELPENRFLQATALVYVVPLLGLLLGLFLGWTIGSGSDLWTLLGAAFGLIAALVTLYGIDRRVSQKPEWAPKITAVYADKPTSDDVGCDIS